jgi:hypothetical protein
LLVYAYTFKLAAQAGMGFEYSVPGQALFIKSSIMTLIGLTMVLAAGFITRYMINIGDDKPARN